MMAVIWCGSAEQRKAAGRHKWDGLAGPHRSQWRIFTSQTVPWLGVEVSSSRKVGHPTVRKDRMPQRRKLLSIWLICVPLVLAGCSSGGVWGEASDQH